MVVTFSACRYPVYLRCYIKRVHPHYITCFQYKKNHISLGSYTRYLTHTSQLHQHFKTFNVTKHTSIVYYALKVAEILHCGCWYDDVGKKCEVDSDGCCKEIFIQKSRMYSSAKARTVYQSSKWQPTDWPIWLKTTLWTWVQFTDIAKLKSFWWSRFSTVTFPDLCHMSSMSKISNTSLRITVS